MCVCVCVFDVKAIYIFHRIDTILGLTMRFVYVVLCKFFMQTCCTSINVGFTTMEYWSVFTYFDGFLFVYFRNNYWDMTSKCESVSKDMGRY